MKEQEIRNNDALNKYLELVKQDVKSFFSFKSFKKVACPACNGSEHTREFIKDGFQYVSCVNCSTFFVNPRPELKTLNKFYSNSKSSRFWVSDFFRPVAEVRRKKIFQPRAEYMVKILNKHKKLIIADVGAGFGLFLEELRKLSSENKYVAIEPSEEMSLICRGKGLKVIDKCLEDIDERKNKFDVLTAFELLEHLTDPAFFIKKVYNLLKPGGYFFLTTLNGKGFDILLLWEKSKSICPPQHLNFFNPGSLEILMKRAGFQIVQVSTPGKLDWDIVEGMLNKENIYLGRFWQELAQRGTSEAKKGLQEWISRNKLSSHMSLLAKKV
jgi:SAM-dependent methyltransferase